MDEELVGEIARELARQDGVDDAAWFRMDGHTPDMRPWQALRGKYAERARCVLGLPGVRRLASDLARSEQDCLEVIDERDRFHEVADQLAYAIAPVEVLGEHSSHNDPWENALRFLDEHPEGYPWPAETPAGA